MTKDWDAMNPPPLDFPGPPGLSHILHMNWKKWVFPGTVYVLAMQSIAGGLMWFESGLRLGGQ